MKRYIILIFSLFVLAVGVGFVASRHATVRASQLIDGHSVHAVSLLSDRSDPSVLAIIKGDYVQFNTKDGRLHDLAQGAGDDEVHQADHNDIHDHQDGGRESGAFAKGQAYRVQFNQVGTYYFHDHLNPKLSIAVVVYESKTSR